MDENTFDAEAKAAYNEWLNDRLEAEDAQSWTADDAYRQAIVDLRERLLP